MDSGQPYNNYAYLKQSKPFLLLAIEKVIPRVHCNLWPAKGILWPASILPWSFTIPGPELVAGLGVGDLDDGPHDGSKGVVKYRGKDLKCHPLHWIWP